MKNIIVRKIRIDEEIALEGVKCLRSDEKLRAFLNELSIQFQETERDIIIGR